jgi:nucleotide-binding universal stress UspA family protein
MFKRILVGVDGSPASNAGLKAAIELASDQRATLVGLHVIDDAAIALNFEGSYFPSSYVDTFYASLRDSGRKTLARAEKLARSADVEMKPLLVEARGAAVAHAIVREARKAKADVIVLGTHGRRGVQRMLMGSDAEAVVREAGVPVMLVRSAERAKRSSRAATKRPAKAASSAQAQAARATP